MITVLEVRQGQEKGHLHPSGDQGELLEGGHLSCKGQGELQQRKGKGSSGTTYTKA